MDNKKMYYQFCKDNYVPIYSKPWWLDAVCEAENWNVWLYSSGGEILAAMPYYTESRGGYQYITKAPLTQNNGILFKKIKGQKKIAEAKMQQKIIDAACEYIRELNVDVFEQQFQTTFQNWLPFYWNGYTNFLRYTYVIENTTDMNFVWENISSNYRKNIKKGEKRTSVYTDISPDEFYECNRKVFSRQGKSIPFSIALWNRLRTSCLKKDACHMMCSRDQEGMVHSILFLVWDDRRMYHLLGGYMREFSSSQSYPALTYAGIKLAHEMGLSYDFEGSMIKPISLAFREFGGNPLPYYRIRKVFNPDLIRKEAEKVINESV